LALIPAHIWRGNVTHFSVRVRVEHVLGCWKRSMDFTIRCIGQIRAASRITMANLSYNFRRVVDRERRCATA